MSAVVHLLTASRANSGHFPSLCGVVPVRQRPLCRIEHSPVYIASLACCAIAFDFGLDTCTMSEFDAPEGIVGCDGLIEQ